MDIESLIKTYVIDHYAFFFLSFIIGIIIQWLKVKIFPLLENQVLVDKILPTLGLIFGLSFGIIGHLIFGKELVTSTGVESTSAKILYYMASGAFSTYFYLIVNRLLKNYNVIEEEIKEEVKPNDENN